MNLFEELIEDIKIEYVNNANSLGWRFLQTSKQNLETNNGILLITLNPGGKENRTDQPIESCEDGCAYLMESWKNKPPGASRLQCQVQGLFKEIASKAGIEDYKVVLESAVCGHFIPFRSPSLALLKDKDRSISFSKNLWKKILLNIEFQVIFCIDKDTYKSVREILLGISYATGEPKEYPIEWGRYKSLVASFEKENKKITLVWFPHLSTFSIFGREKSQEAVHRIIRDAMKNYKYLQSAAV